MITSDTIYREILKSFNPSELASYSSADIHGRSDLLMITPNGEICYDPNDKMFTVFDETYIYTVGKTPYPMVALNMFSTYCHHYLDGE